MLTDAIGDFLVANDVTVVVSLDGDSDSHNRNRVMLDGNGTHELVMARLQRFRERHPEFDKIMLSGVYDWRTDLAKVAAFFDEFEQILPPLFRCAGVSPGDTDYYERFTEVERSVFAAKKNALAKTYFDTRCRGEHVPPFVRTLFEQSLMAVLLRGRHGDGRNPLTPFTACCVPGSKISVRCDGTLDVCERVNGQRPIGDLDTGIDTGAVLRMVRDYSDRVCGRCWECNVSRMCTECYATRACGDSFTEASCDKTRVAIAQELVAVYSILEQQPGAFDTFQQVNDSLRFFAG